jgi:streptogramin lyase
VKLTVGQNCGSNSSGPRGIAIDASNNLWAGTYNSSMYYYINGTNGAILKKIDLSSMGHRAYGAIVDKQGALWSADMNGYLLRLDTATNASQKVNIGNGQYNAYGMGLDRNGYLYVAGWCSGKLSAINTANGQVMWTRDTGDGCSRGIAVTNDGDFWVANSNANTVSRWSNSGQKKAVISGFSHPTGVATDAAGKVWVVDYGNSNIHRINPATNGIEMTKVAGGSGHYGYSDMTGIVARSMTTKLGTLTLNFDSGAVTTGWDSVSWSGTTPNGTSIKGRVRSSNDRTAWSAWEDVSPGVPIKTVPAGRYLQTEATLQVFSGEISPVLADLTVKVK